MSPHAPGAPPSPLHPLVREQVVQLVVRQLIQFGQGAGDLLVPEEERAELQARAANLPRLQLSARNICDLELLAAGGFSPVNWPRS